MAALDPWGKNGNLRNPLTNGETVTPNDTQELGYISRGLYIGVGGDVSVLSYYSLSSAEVHDS